MPKFLFLLKNQNILIEHESKIEAIKVINKTFDNILENDFRVITISVEVDKYGEILNSEENF